MITVAHFVTPYLFATGSWIHTQLVRARSTRPVVLTRALENTEAFPFDPVTNVTASRKPLQKTRDLLLFYAGRYDPGPYLPHLRAEAATLIHAHLGWEGVRALPVARASGLPLVTSFYGRDAALLPRYPWWRLLYRRLFREGDTFLVEGPVLGETLEALGCPAQKIRVIHLGIDLTRIPFAERRPLPGGRVEILISSSLRPKKGVAGAVRAFAAIAQQFPQARLRILGSGPECHKVRATIRRHRLDDRVAMEGHVSYQHHIAALGRAHVFVAASRTAPDGDSEGGAPVSLLEAQAAGLPILSTRHADIPEIVADGTSGLLSPEFDDQALARNLQWVLEHPEQWPDMGRRGRQHVERGFDAEIQVEKAAAVYRELLDRK